MTIDEAKNVLFQCDDNILVFRIIRAAATLCFPENFHQVTLSELISCMRRGNSCKELGIVSEYAALALYHRTKRPRKSDVPYDDFVTDADDWERYLEGALIIDMFPKN